MTCEPQYTPIHTFAADHGQEQLGLMAGHTWHEDPKRLLFTLARYKWVAKMLAGQRQVLEVGCGDGWASRIVRQHVERLTCVDMDEAFIANARKNVSTRWPIKFEVHDFVNETLPILPPWDGRSSPDVLSFTASYALDVLEHIHPDDESDFMTHVCQPLLGDGVLIIGMPSLESQVHASPLSREGHVNCKTQDGLRSLMQRWFKSVFMFGMNDEVVHTGFGSMCHYLLAVGVGKK